MDEILDQQSQSAVGEPPVSEAADAAQRERVRNVLDNRGFVYDAATLERLASGGEDAVREFLAHRGFTPESPLTPRHETDMEVGRLTQ